MKTKVYNLEAKQNSEMELDDAVFAIDIKSELVHEVFICQTANQRQPWAHTKDRSEVRGGGRKPWAQKGTGRARHGSNRSPIWTGGGVTFGPRKDNNYKTKINKKVRRKALKMCLSDRVATDNFKVVEDFNYAEPKTKLFSNFLEKLFTEQKGSKSFLILTAGKDEKIMRMTKNLKNVSVIRAEDLNVMEVLNKKDLIASREAVDAIVKTLTK